MKEAQPQLRAVAVALIPQIHLPHATNMFFLKLKLDYVWSPVQKSFNDITLPLEKFFGVLYKLLWAYYATFYDWPCLILPHPLGGPQRHLPQAVWTHRPWFPQGSLHVQTQLCVPHPLRGQLLSPCALIPMQPAGPLQARWNVPSPTACP